MNGFTLFMCLVAGIAAVSATDYCSSTICSAGVTHIACGHSGDFDSTCPADAAMVTMSSSLQQILVDAHNEKRNYVAGGNEDNLSSTCRMATMQWDDELASIAALNVKQCQMAHDKCRNTDDFKYSGQNLAWMGFYGTIDDESRLKQAVQMWYDEVSDCTQSIIDQYPSGYTGPTIGHFTVMMADRNIRVGCAASTYTPTGVTYTAYLVACNYATTNMINFPIYGSCSTAASGCTSGTNPDYPNLCSTSEAYSVNTWY